MPLAAVATTAFDRGGGTAASLTGAVIGIIVPAIYATECIGRTARRQPA